MPTTAAGQLAKEFESIAVMACSAAKLQSILHGIPLFPDELLTKLLHLSLGVLVTPVNAVSNLRRSILRGCERLSVPVISVGNLTYGGSGKSPFCRWLARRCIEMGFKVGIVLPSYSPVSAHHAASLTEDELLEHSQYLPHVPVAMGRRREVAARRLIERDGCDLVVLDDGFQYRLLHRDLDIVLVDGLHAPHIFCPMLREPLKALRRANIVCLTKVNAARAFMGDEHLGEFENTLRKASGISELVKVDYIPIDLFQIITGELLQQEQLAGVKAIGVVGTAEPYSFFYTARRLGINLIKLFVFEDHHSYSSEEVSFFCEAMRRYGAEVLITTLKDAMRLRSSILNLTECYKRFNSWYAVRIDVRIIDGVEVLEGALNRVMKIGMAKRC